MFYETINLEEAAERANKVQERANRLKSELEETHIGVTSKDKKVTVEVDSFGKLLSLHILADSSHDTDIRSLEKALFATIRGAQEAAERYRKESTEKYFSS